MDQFSFDDQPDKIRLRTAWDQVLRRLNDQVPGVWMERFLRTLRPISLSDGTATLGAPGRFVLEWVLQKYHGLLQEMLSDELGESISLEITAEPREKELQSAPALSVATAAVKPAPALARFIPNPRYTFENFVVGESNRLAVAGAMAVANERNCRFNPLFIYGDTGMGKTHLLHAIAGSILEREPDFPIMYVTGQQFVEDFVHALQTNRMEQFRRLHRNVGLWLVDDIQFIAGRDKTQEEFFHTFNYLQSLNKQIVLISDKSPRMLRTTDERLTSRFESGLPVDIQPPDTETRCAIILSKAIQDEIDIEQEVAMHLAENVPGNIRVLEGALTRLAAQASVLGRAIDLDLASQVVDKHYGDKTSARPTFTQIVGAVSQFLEVSEEDIKGIRRNAPIVHARHIAIYITREMTGDSWKHIGTLFGDRDHTSMIHGYNKISDLIVNDKELRVTVKRIIRHLKAE